jgi:hypothetical protein
MSKVYRRCCGMDVHKATVVVCLLPPDGESGEMVRKIFGTFRNELARMRAWFKQKTEEGHPYRDGVDRRVLDADMELPG